MSLRIAMADTSMSVRNAMARTSMSVRNAMACTSISVRNAMPVRRWGVVCLRFQRGKIGLEIKTYRLWPVVEMSRGLIFLGVSSAVMVI